jgi:2-iminoacetate synthase
MTFVSEFNTLPVHALLHTASVTNGREVKDSLHRSHLTLTDFAHLISPVAQEHLEPLCRRSQAVTQQRFGKVIRLFAPLYVSNECINTCRYCGFSRENSILRVTLSIDEVRQEASALFDQGFRSVLLVAGEHPKFVSRDYLTECVAAVRPIIPSVALEVGPFEPADYGPLVAAGAEGLVVYQETYDRAAYAGVHTAGPKRDFDWRLETAERAYAAGFRRLGIGALFGLADWRHEAICLAAHALYLLRTCWKAQLTVSLPRLRPCAGEFQPPASMTDTDLVQLVCALRLLLPDVGLVLSTREPARLRDGLMPIGITTMSAGSHTEPGGYTGAGSSNVHRTERGRIIAVDTASEWAAGRQTAATEQFEISDERSPSQIAETIRRVGYEPVWKDWDAALSA